MIQSQENNKLAILNDIYNKSIPYINKNHLTGEVEAHQMNHFVFEE